MMAANRLPASSNTEIPINRQPEPYQKPMNTRFLTLLGALALLLAPFATAAVPDTIDYQGLVLDKDGKPLSPITPTNYSMEFRIYSDPFGGTAIWTEKQIVTVVDGKFSVRLGEGAAVDPPEPRPTLSEAFTSSPRFLGLKVEIPGQTPGEITPRLAFLSAPFAFRSETSGTSDLATNATTASRIMQVEGTSTLGTTTIEKLTANGILDADIISVNTIETRGSGKVTAYEIEATGTAKARNMVSDGNIDAISGTITANKFSGDGSLLTNVDLEKTTGSLSSGRLVVNSDLRLNGAHKINFINASTSFIWNDNNGINIIGKLDNLTGTHNEGIAGALSVNSDAGLNPVLTWGADVANHTSGISLYNYEYSDEKEAKWNIQCQYNLLLPVFSSFHISRSDQSSYFFINYDGSHGQSSDSRLKKDIRDLPATLEAVLRLKPVTYYMKDMPDAPNQPPSYGFIAQDVLPVLPDLVSGGQGEAYYGITSSYFPAILVRAIQDFHGEAAQDKQALQDEIARLGAENASLRAGLDDLKARLLKLEAAAK